MIMNNTAQTDLIRQVAKATSPSAIGGRRPCSSQ